MFSFHGFIKVTETEEGLGRGWYGPDWRTGQRRRRAWQMGILWLGRKNEHNKIIKSRLERRLIDMQKGTKKQQQQSDSKKAKPTSNYNNWLFIIKAKAPRQLKISQWFCGLLPLLLSRRDAAKGKELTDQQIISRPVTVHILVYIVMAHRQSATLTCNSYTHTYTHRVTAR